MTDQDPYAQGAVWVHTTTKQTVHILTVFEDTQHLVPGQKEDSEHAYVVVAGKHAEPDVWSVQQFLGWFERPDGSTPQPQPFIPRQQDTDNRRNP